MNSNSNSTQIDNQGFTSNRTSPTSPTISTAILSECQSLQQDELIALQSIYPSKHQFSILNSADRQQAQSQAQSQSESHSQSHSQSPSTLSTEPKLRLSIPINFADSRRVRITTFSFPDQSTSNSSSDLKPRTHRDGQSIASPTEREVKDQQDHVTLASASSSHPPVRPDSFSESHSRVDYTSNLASRNDLRSIDAQLAKEARRSHLSKPDSDGIGTFLGRDDESDVSISSKGKGKLKARSRLNGKNGAAKTENPKGKAKAKNEDTSHPIPPWESRAKTFSRLNQDSDLIKSKNKNDDSSKVGLVAGVSHGSNSTSNSTRHSSCTCLPSCNDSCRNGHPSSISNSTSRKFLNPKAKQFSPSTNPDSTPSTLSASIPSTPSNLSDSIRDSLSTSTESQTKTATIQRTSRIIQVSSLPSITIYLTLPPTYPLKSPPLITSLSSPYLLDSTPIRYNNHPKLHPQANLDLSPSPSISSTQTKEWIQSKLTDLWNESQSECIWNWAEFLAEGVWDDKLDANPFFKSPRVESEVEARSREVESEPELEIDQDGEAVIQFLEMDSPHPTLTAPSPISLGDLLLEFDQTNQSETFANLTFNCPICLETKRGSKCHEIQSCKHVFCLECLKDYLSCMVLEGFHLQSNRCPDADCVKKSVQEEEAQVERKRFERGTDQNHCREEVGEEEEQGLTKGKISSQELFHLLGPELHSRYLWLISKNQLESNPTSTNCPRASCPGICVLKQEDVGTRFENFRNCPECDFNFCFFCKKSWHGLTPCKLNNSMELVEKFLSLQENSNEREEMYRKFGRKNLDRLVKNCLEEKANRDWLDESTAKCPCCGVFIEKSLGCNHMTCRNCQTHFCYLCQSRLNPREPYRHFNTPNSPCYQKLFEGALPHGMGVDGQMIPGFEGIELQDQQQEDVDLDELNFPARLLQDMLRDL